MSNVLKRILSSSSPQHGTDPELFISQTVGKVRKRESIIASEVVIPADGLTDTSGDYRNYSKVTRDGVQVELHPSPSTCRQSLSYYIGHAINMLQKHLTTINAERGTNYHLNFSQTVKLSKSDMDAMSPDAKQLGCTPSKNVYGHASPIVEGEKIDVRSGAGHVHVGTELLKMGVDPERMVKIYDVLLGNTAVLLDRDPGAIERRKLYGKAGEYRLPKHGLEYRTISNFWLRHYVLESFVFGMSAVAHNCAGVSLGRPAWYTNSYSSTTWFEDADKILMENVDLRQIEKAINENDWELARNNYERWVKPFLAQTTTDKNRGIDSYLIKPFDYFVDQIRRAELAGNPDPLSVWFGAATPESIVQHWNHEDSSSRAIGFESFLLRPVTERMPTTFAGLVMVDTTKPAEAIPTINVPIEVPAEAPRVGGVINVT